MKNTIQHPTRGRLVCRVFDAPEFADRYTIAFKGWRSHGRMVYPYLASSERPFHPQGVGLYGESANFVTGRSLGKRIPFSALPLDVQKFVMQSI
jgi:hypothetical protein